MENKYKESWHLLFVRYGLGFSSSDSNCLQQQKQLKNMKVLTNYLNLPQCKWPTEDHRESEMTSQLLGPPHSQGQRD